MKLTLRQTTVMFVALFTLSTSALANESNKTPTTAQGSGIPLILDTKKVDREPAVIDTSVITLADKILAEQAHAEARMINDSFPGTSPSRQNHSAKDDADALVSEWLEEHAGHAHAAAEASARITAPSRDHEQEMGMEMGGGWCDICGCWMRHGDDPNGTPEEEIGHPHICSGAGSQSCWTHSARNCFSS